MANVRARIIAVRDAQAAIGITLERLPLSTEDASQLAAELKESEVRHPEAIAAGLAEIVAAAAPPAGDSEASIRYFERLSKAADKFWDAFEGQVVDGVEIIRRRA